MNNNYLFKAMEQYLQNLIERSKERNTELHIKYVYNCDSVVREVEYKEGNEIKVVWDGVQHIVKYGDDFSISLLGPTISVEYDTRESLYTLTFYNKNLEVTIYEVEKPHIEKEVNFDNEARDSVIKDGLDKKIFERLDNLEKAISDIQSAIQILELKINRVGLGFPNFGHGPYPWNRDKDTPRHFPDQTICGRGKTIPQSNRTNIF